jgi:hypothetical protein
MWEMLMGAAQRNELAARTEVVDAVLARFSAVERCFRGALDRYAVVNDLESLVWEVVASFFAEHFLDVAIVHEVLRPTWAPQRVL